MPPIKGKKVILVEQNPRLGGICLNVGCIPSKALLHATEIMRELKDSAARGIEFGQPKVNLDKLRAWKDSILDKLGQGIKMPRPKTRRAKLIHGRGHFEDSQTLRVETSRRTKVYPLRKSYHRRRLQTGDAFGIRSRQSAHYDIHRGAGDLPMCHRTCW